MRARVWSTESWTWAAICARSSASARAWRSAMRSRTRLSHQGPKMTTAAAMTSTAPPTGRTRRRWCGPRPGRRSRPPRPNAQDHTGDEPATTLPVPVRPQQRHDVFVDERLLGLAGVAPDEDDDADGQEGGPAEKPDEPDVQGAGDELHGDQEWQQNGHERPDATAVGDGARVDIAAVPLHRDQQPRHGVHEDHDAAGDRQQDEADADPHGVDPGLPRDGAADTTQDPVVGAPAQTP